MRARVHSGVSLQRVSLSPRASFARAKASIASCVATLLKRRKAVSASRNLKLRFVKKPDQLRGPASRCVTPRTCARFAPFRAAVHLWGWANMKLHPLVGVDELHFGEGISQVMALKGESAEKRMHSRPEHHTSSRYGPRTLGFRYPGAGSCKHAVEPTTGTTAP